MKKLVLHLVALLFAFAVLSPTNANAVVYDPDNEERVYLYLTEEMELNDAAAAGILANIQHESWFDPTASYQDVNGNISYGICQWNGERFESLKAICAENGLDYTTLDGQLPYLQHELEGDERSAYDRIRNVPNTVDGAYTAAYNWAKYFERCLQFWNGVDQFDSRGILAEQKYWYRNSDISTVTVSFRANGGECLRTYKKIPAGSVLGRLPVAEREGYQFNGWYTEDGRQASESVVVQNHMTLTAKWTEVLSEPVQPAVQFGDVSASDYFYEPVRWAVEKGVTSGTSSETFSPDAACTRGQIVTFLWRAAGSPEPQNSYVPFVDVSETDYFRKAVLWAVENEITAGTSDVTFSPDAPCTRAQVAVFLWRAKGKPAVSDQSNPFFDVQPGDYYYNAVLWAAENRITSGIGDGQYGSEAPCTRGQIVTFLYRTFSIENRIRD